MIKLAASAAFLFFTALASAQITPGEYTGTFNNNDGSRDGKVRMVFAKNGDNAWECKFFFNLGGDEVSATTTACVIDGSKLTAEYDADAEGTPVHNKMAAEMNADKLLEGTYKAYDPKGEELLDSGKWKASSHQ